MVITFMGVVLAAVAGAAVVSDDGTRPYRLTVPATAAGLPIDQGQTEEYRTYNMEQDAYSRRRYEAELGGEIDAGLVGAVYADPADGRLVIFRGLTGSGLSPRKLKSGMARLLREAGLPSALRDVDPGPNGGSAVCTPPAKDVACTSMTSTTIVMIEFVPMTLAPESRLDLERALRILHGVRAAAERPA
ncbi:hypothetical protein [Spirillospora sp. CA-128828]|uniref:hypothetical protein n=1 Tax=Spirillospora sp. CA-128828 TaxID=3240033 RepID=UPI003D90734E